ncbi:hypothetical protein JOD02_002129 [Caldicoprobacter guelmensis]|uniref:hypothetical protein n=1 Tax=Caldicoprobacter guelmensis TaxID=1170224 RepID=UPI00195E2577|nr:hypothetical protein [Caldicoprobacter guelmensis]MBM7583248.1 hypothetical protein [Caldicoprobacter guelmensis]
MRNRILMLIKRIIQAVIELIAFFPLILMLAVFTIPEPLAFGWAAFLAVCYIIGILLRSILRKKPRITAVLPGIIITFLVAYVAFRGGLLLWGSYILGSILLFRGVFLVERGWEGVFPPVALWVGILIYFISYFFFKHSTVLMSYADLIEWMGFVYIGISLIVFNVQQLKTATLSKEDEPSLPVTVLIHNRLLIVITFLVIIILTNLNRFKQVVLWLVNSIMLLILKVILFLSNLVPMDDLGGEVPPDKGMLDMLPEAEPRAPNIFDYLFEILAYVLAIAFVVALVVALVIMLYRITKRLIKLLVELIKQDDWIEADAGYVDVKEKVTDIKTLSKEYVNRWKDWLASLIKKEPRWEDLSDVVEKVRYLYRRFLISCMDLGYHPKDYMTPNEIKEDLKGWDEAKGRQAEVLVPLYNLVKYGNSAGQLIDQDKLNDLAKMIDNRFGG